MDRVDDIEKLLHHGYFLVDEMHLSVHCLKKKTEIVQELNFWLVNEERNGGCKCLVGHVNLIVRQAAFVAGM
jgi:hypothetical protein